MEDSSANVMRYVLNPEPHIFCKVFGCTLLIEFIIQRAMNLGLVHSQRAIDMSETCFKVQKDILTTCSTVGIYREIQKCLIPA